ncbi:MAG: succinate dehydrogenase/fumarate reductase iron-sulfur subunit [Planctomycetota bacterium]|jgi:succinate dehydrogenase / fumarate reductase iron-sulfur subunit
MKFTLKIWRQAQGAAGGTFETYPVDDVSPDQSFLEMMDTLNQRLISEGKDPVAFDSDCREGICGTCGFMISGQAHGPEKLITACQLHMRVFPDGDTITCEPWRAKPFPIIKDLMVDRSAFDRIIQAGGYISAKTGSAVDANSMLVPQDQAEASMDAATCIGCGACVASCVNASASLFTSAKIAQFALLPQGQAERKSRALRMVMQMDEEGFGNCTNETECEASCPKGIDVHNIARMRREFLRAGVTPRVY